MTGFEVSTEGSTITALQFAEASLGAKRNESRTFSPLSRTPSTASTGTETTRRAMRTLRLKPSRKRIGWLPPDRSRASQTANSSFRRPTTRETALFDKCFSPKSGAKAFLTLRLLAPAR